MKKCDKNCPAICDFCKHYQYNGEDLLDENGKVVAKNAVYVGLGFCTDKCQLKEPFESCKNFHCRMVKGKEK